MDNRAAASAPQIDGVVFDCDGVLVDSESLSTQVTQKIVADLGWHVELDVLGDLLTGCSHEFYVEQVEKNIGRTLEPGWDDPYRGWLERALRAELTAVPGIHRAVADIDLPTAVASNSRHERIRMSLELVGLLPAFDGTIVSAEDVAAGKPAPDVYLRAAQLIGVPPARCVAVDDSPFGVIAAQRAGMFVLAFAGTADPRRLPTGNRTHVFDDMEQLPELIRALRADGRIGDLTT